MTRADMDNRARRRIATCSAPPSIPPQAGSKSRSREIIDSINWEEAGGNYYAALLRDRDSRYEDHPAGWRSYRLDLIAQAVTVDCTHEELVTAFDTYDGELLSKLEAACMAWWTKLPDDTCAPTPAPPPFPTIGPKEVALWNLIQLSWAQDLLNQTQDALVARALEVDASIGEVAAATDLPLRDAEQRWSHLPSARVTSGSGLDG
jgi:hypothetical protein